ncbi:EAL and HDOD domain-containing protein [Bacterioplanoides pacificum]|uniref:EAL and HDOD domain-containing protein n=1 Tax=Bacterioplanoides pacificum TaxID=1171596 RepID=A0ABV7VXF2_9GAMM
MSELPLLARQPILDNNLQVVGYELLCRPLPQDTQQWQETYGDYATSEVMIGAYQEIGFETVTRGLPAFINFTRGWLLNPPIISAKVLVAEILEYIQADDDSIRAIEKLRRMNYRVALDDFVGADNQVALLPYVDIIKVDILQLDDLDQLAALISRYQRPGLTWLAEKVETAEEYEICRDAGCTLFQGYFFARPAVMYGRRIPDNKISIMQLIEQLNRPDVEITDVSRVLQSEPQLSFRLLQLVNSAAIGCVSEVTSIQHAITLAGLDRIRAWANVLALGQLSDKPQILREQAVLRGYLAQQLASISTHLDPNTAFTIGLFSLLDAFMDLPMSELCDRLHLPDALRDALLTRQGNYGELLSLTEHYEQANWHKVDWPRLQQLGIHSAQLSQCYQQALQDCRELLSPQHQR